MHGVASPSPPVAPAHLHGQCPLWGTVIFSPSDPAASPPAPTPPLLAWSPQTHILNAARNFLGKGGPASTPWVKTFTPEPTPLHFPGGGAWVCGGVPVGRLVAGCLRPSCTPEVLATQTSAPSLWLCAPSRHPPTAVTLSSRRPLFLLSLEHTPKHPLVASVGLWLKPWHVPVCLTVYLPRPSNTASSAFGPRSSSHLFWVDATHLQIARPL